MFLLVNIYIFSLFQQMLERVICLLIISSAVPINMNPAIAVLPVYLLFVRFSMKFYILFLISIVMLSLMLAVLVHSSLLRQYCNERRVKVDKQ